jgi:hypothetical protein
MSNSGKQLDKSEQKSGNDDSFPSNSQKVTSDSETKQTTQSVSVMNYDEMIGEKKEDFQKSYNAYNEKFTVEMGKFVVFTHREMKEDDLDRVNHVWKAHISIHPEDLAYAWSFIYSKLEKNALTFKIADKKIVQEVLKYLKSVSVFLNKNQSFTDDELSKLMGEPTDRVKIQNGIIQNQRLLQGMQVTIYIFPGTEKIFESVLTDIETILIKNGIRPGQIYPTDRRLGEFSSVRHPGNQYTDAITVENYNPDNVLDPFHDLSTKDAYLIELQSRVEAAKDHYVSSGSNHSLFHTKSVKKNAKTFFAHFMGMKDLHSAHVFLLNYLTDEKTGNTYAGSFKTSLLYAVCCPKHPTLFSDESLKDYSKNYNTYVRQLQERFNEPTAKLQNQETSPSPSEPQIVDPLKNRGAKSGRK